MNEEIYIEEKSRFKTYNEKIIESYAREKREKGYTVKIEHDIHGLYIVTSFLNITFSSEVKE